MRRPIASAPFHPPAKLRREAPTPPVKLVLYGQPGCCLCDRLIGLVQPHLTVLMPSGEAALIKRDITENPLWQRLYGDRIPVLTTESGRVILEGRPDAGQVQRALTQWAQDASKR